MMKRTLIRVLAAIAHRFGVACVFGDEITVKGTLELRGPTTVANGVLVTVDMA